MRRSRESKFLFVIVFVLCVMCCAVSAEAALGSRYEKPVQGDSAVKAPAAPTPPPAKPAPAPKPVETPKPAEAPKPAAPAAAQAAPKPAPPAAGGAVGESGVQVSDAVGGLLPEKIAQKLIKSHEEFTEAMQRAEMSLRYYMIRDADKMKKPLTSSQHDAMRFVVLGNLKDFDSATKRYLRNVEYAMIAMQIWNDEEVYRFASMLPFLFASPAEAAFGSSLGQAALGSLASELKGMVDAGVEMGRAAVNTTMGALKSGLQSVSDTASAAYKGFQDASYQAGKAWGAFSQTRAGQITIASGKVLFGVVTTAGTAYVGTIAIVAAAPVAAVGGGIALTLSVVGGTLGVTKETIVLISVVTEQKTDKDQTELLGDIATGFQVGGALTAIATDPTAVTVVMETGELLISLTPDIIEKAIAEAEGSVTGEDFKIILKEVIAAEQQNTDSGSDGGGG